MNRLKYENLFDDLKEKTENNIIFAQKEVSIQNRFGQEKKRELSLFFCDPSDHELSAKISTLAKNQRLGFHVEDVPVLHGRNRRFTKGIHHWISQRMKGSENFVTFVIKVRAGACVQDCSCLIFHIS